MKKVLALDPSFRNTGYAVITVGKRDKVVDSGVIKTEARAKKSNVRAADQTLEQIQVMVNSIREVISRHEPEVLIAELPTSGGKSARAVASMAIAQAVCGAVAAYEDIPTEWITPTDNKKGMTGRKTASKEDMMTEAVSRYPELEAQYTHNKGQYKGQLRGEFEHVADAIGAYEAAKQTSPFIRYIRNQ